MIIMHFNINALMICVVFRKEWVFKTMVVIGSFASVILCYLATISAMFYYSDSFKFKEQLFVTFIAFQSLNELSRPVFLTLLIDQLVNLNDFTADTSKIFSCFYLSKEFCRLAAFAIAVYTSTSKAASAKGQIIPPILALSAINIFILITYWKYPLISYPPHYHGIVKIVGNQIQRCCEFIVKKICRCKSYKHLIKYSEKTSQDSKRFYNIVLLLLCVVPHYYSISIVAEGSITKKIISDDPQQVAIQKVYGQCVILTFLIVSQFVIFPMLYRTKLKKVVSSPLRCMITCYVVVGVCGAVAFVILCVHQHKEPQLYHTKTSKVMTVYNMLNDTVVMELLNDFGGDVQELKPWERHEVVLEKDRVFRVAIRNKKLFLDDYHEFDVNKSDSFVLTVFGLEALPVSPG
uniref:Uncharacterized protein n=1 Tax=Lygus hesperus TaxID=30085 RepID=A0A0A9WBP1_LYGHE